MKVVNLFAGPGAGKSTMACGLFYKLKQQGFLAEYVTEYAKSLVWEERSFIFQDQLYITAKQNRKLVRLNGKVDLAITDSPIILGLNYRTPDCYLPSIFTDFVLELFNKYDNQNFFINRKKLYTTTGRRETYAEAVKMDVKIKGFLKNNNIPFTEVDGDDDGLENVLYSIKKNLKECLP